jgi:hypothetical protein
MGTLGGACPTIREHERATDLGAVIGTTMGAIEGGSDVGG